MKGPPPRIRVVVVEPLPAHHLWALKELVGRAALRKLRVMQEGQRKASPSLLSKRPRTLDRWDNHRIKKGKGEVKLPRLSGW